MQPPPRTACQILSLHLTPSASPLGNRSPLGPAPGGPSCWQDLARPHARHRLLKGAWIDLCVHAGGWSRCLLLPIASLPRSLGWPLPAAPAVSPQRGSCGKPCPGRDCRRCAHPASVGERGAPPVSHPCLWGLGERRGGAHSLGGSPSLLRLNRGWP